MRFGKVQKLIFVSMGIVLVTAFSFLFFLPHRSWKLVSANRLESITFDLYKAEGLMFNMGESVSDSMRAIVYANIFSRYKVNQQDYDSSLVYYSVYKSEKLMHLWQRVSDSLRAEGKTIDSLSKLQFDKFAEFDPYLLRADSVNLLPPDSINFFILDGRIINKYFSLPAVPTRSEKGRTFILTARVLGVNPRDRIKLSLNLRTISPDSVIESVSGAINHSGISRVQVRIPGGVTCNRLIGSIKTLGSGSGSGKCNLRPKLIALDSVSLIHITDK